MLSHIQVRNLFKTFWKNNNHKEIPAIPLVPKDDPTTLFTGSGMQQLVPYLLGEVHPQGNRLFNIQPCIRAQDIEEVGDNRHDTFFEMMGNWSLGDYFKKEQLVWFWEFLTKKLNLPPEKLYVTVFAGIDDIPEDTESYQTWKKIGVTDNKIYKYQDNWWSRAGAPKNMPIGEPGGPDSEVFYEFTQVPHNKKFGENCHPNCDCGRFLEIGNCVFMEYKKENDGSFKPLPKKNVDFGGGLERIMAAINDDPDTFKTDLYQPIIKAIENQLQISYSEEKNKTAMRIIADHSKDATFLILNGVYPSNKEQGYFLRRLIRRMMTKTRNLKNNLVNADDFSNIFDGVFKVYDQVYSNAQKDKSIVLPIITEEINRFSRALENGLKETKKIEKIDGKIAFDLYQSFGFPLEITEEIFLDKGQSINKKQFRDEFEKHRQLSKSSSIGKFKGGLADQGAQTLKYHTATHLLHQALFDVLGNEVRQEGSNINGERLRFDFYLSKKPSPEEIKKVSEIINQKITDALPVTMKIVPKIEAEKLGAKSFFREKYPEMVKVYFIGPSASSGQATYSKEFCGGPHVKNTAEIKKIEIFKFEKIGSNLYRIYAK